MKILIVSEYFPSGENLNFSGGVETRNLYIAKHLSKKHEVTVLTSRLKGTKDHENLLGANVVRVGRERDYNPTVGDLWDRLCFVAAAISVSKEIDFDLVEGTNFITHFIASWAGRHRRKPVIFWYPDVWIGKWVQNAGIAGLLGEVLERVNLRIGANRYIAISQATAVKLKNYVAGDVSIIPCGIEESEYNKKPIKRNKQIICISRLAKYKNIKDLILAFALLDKKIKDTNLAIVGQGPEERRIKDLITHLNLNNVSLYKNLERKKMIALLQESYLFCLPSSVEGFGISVIEAAACGIPFVISNIPSFVEISNNGKGGILFKVGDIKSLEKSMASLIAGGRLYMNKQKELPDIVKSYSWKKIARDTENVYLKTV